MNLLSMAKPYAGGWILTNCKVENGAKCIVSELRIVDKFARKLWGDKVRNVNSCYASTNSYSWFSFINNINSCIPAPTWQQIKSYATYYCEKRGKSAQDYIELFDLLECRGYSSVFYKVSSVSYLYMKDLNLENIPPDYRMIFEFFQEKQTENN